MKKLPLVLIALPILVYAAYWGHGEYHEVQRKAEELTVREKIERANYCKVEADCIDIGMVCPFGCNIHVNKGEVPLIKETLETYYKTQDPGQHCVYKCALTVGVECVENKCKNIFKQHMR